MLKFFKELHPSDKLVDQLAQEIGVEPKLFKAALAELDINFSQLKQAFEQKRLDERDQGFNEREMLQRACMGVISYARLGGAKLIEKFGLNPDLEAFLFALIDYQEVHIDVVDDPDTYRRERMYQ